jgi:hypothetical protein
MDENKPVLQITTQEWQAKKMRGLATVIYNRRYIVMTHEITNEPVYQPVTVLEADTRQ